MKDTFEKAIEQLRVEVATLRARQAVSDKALDHLRDIHSIAFIEGAYDPYNDKSHEAAVKIWPHIKALNDELRFKT